MITNVNTDDVSRKRKAKGTKTKEKKSRKEQPTVVAEPDEATMEELDESPTTDNDGFVDKDLEQRIQEMCDRYRNT